ncbi:MBL fold metallo-hydrolase [Candidatus Collierbacteria bacterium CG10_big_fil_rev_8_21_14_0_10_44_9]|uniref:MBL fold metallo-hydrolase n=1 Tax=Candidatus Collierbacteria bacterium CG10_big_fil_rev_8_21_14_0_10_44_9 TaxID=1974535 RepID=A0A2H0VIG7_9BACT|nr:MAG: MBL fold metallo-hydrolase [Candidatus Collierbacteria bacterium CG10_big_fil_rev_8_21_14_0_10_44_9]
MEISYLGHSCFKMKTKSGVVVTDPYDKYIGFPMPSVSADIVTVSHLAHRDHAAVELVSGNSKRDKPFVISQPGEYEVEGVSVFGYPSFHDAVEGKDRGINTVYVIQAEDMRILHLGDLGHALTEKMVGELENIDVVMIPVGGVYTIGTKEAVEIIAKLEPYYVLPMHYRTEKYDQKVFGELDGVEKFIAAYEHGSRSVKSLSLSKLSFSEDLTEVITFE